MQRLGARAAVVFGTAGERMLSDPSFLPIWDEFARAKLPLCVHMGMSYPPLAQLGQSIYDGHVIGMSLPAQLAFMAIVGHRMLDRYPDLKVAFLEFGAEWIFYMVSRMDHYLPLDRGAHPFGLSMPNAAQLPRDNIRDYVKSGRIFIAAEADDRMLHQLVRAHRRGSRPVFIRLSPRRGTRKRRAGNHRAQGSLGETKAKAALRQHRAFVR